MRVIDSNQKNTELEELSDQSGISQPEQTPGRPEEQTRPEPASKQEKKDRRNLVIILLAFLAAASMMVAVWAVSARNRALSQAGEAPAASQTDAVPEQKPDNGSIALPQMAWINLKADTVEQSRTFTNPEENSAQFRVTIFAEGDVLWQSELLKPGETSQPMRLNFTLPAGEYSARLIYECFTNDPAMTPLNGADSPVILKFY